MNVKETVYMLNRLHALCAASEHVFDDASHQKDRVAERVLMDIYAGQRAQFAREIENILLGMGSGIDRANYPFSGYLRVYRDQNCERDRDAISMGAIQQGEAVFIKEYRNVLSRNIPGSIAVVLETHLEEIQQLSRQLRGFNDDQHDGAHTAHNDSQLPVTHNGRWTVTDNVRKIT